MRNSPKKILAALLCIALLLALIIFLNLEGDSKRDISPQDILHETNPLPLAELVTDQQPDKQPDIFGIVEDEDGNPLEGVVVEVKLPASDGSAPGTKVVSSEGGAYSISGMTLGNSYELVASLTGFIPSFSGEFLLDKSPMAMDFVLAKIKPADEREAKLSQDKIDEILAGARASIERIHSGRIVYERDRIIPRFEHEDTYYSYVRTETENLKNEGWTDYQIQVKMSEMKVEWEKRHDTEESAHHEYAGEYIFEGDNSVHSVVTLSNPDTTETCYRYNNRVIVVKTDSYSNEMSVEIHRGTTVRSVYLQSPLLDFKFVADMLQEQARWIKPWIMEDNGETVYSFERVQYPRNLYDSYIKIAPSKGHLIRDYGWISTSDWGLARNIYFDNFRWSPGADLYYPTEIMKTWAELGIITEMIKLDFQEVEFNRDYDDNIFKPVFEEVMSISDYRFDPPRHFGFQFPDDADEYLAEWDEEAKRLEKENQDGR